MKSKTFPRRILVCLGFAAFLALAVVPRSGAEDIHIIAPYLGAITDIQKDTSYNLTDTRLIEGLYGQWINPELYQWNVFAYHAADLNYSSVLGGHFIFDFYFGPSDWGGKFLLGAGIELMNFDMNAGNNIVPLSNFVQTMTVTVPYLRAGKYFILGSDQVRLSILPWVGIQPLWVSGSGSFVPPGPPMTVTMSLDSYELDGIAGINLKLTLFHFFEIEGKYQATFNAGSYRSVVTVSSNIFFTRNLGITYRFKYAQETSTGTDIYHMAGVVIAF